MSFTNEDRDEIRKIVREEYDKIRSIEQINKEIQENIKNKTKELYNYIVWTNIY